MKAVSGQEFYAQKRVNTFLCPFLLGMGKLFSSTVFESLKFQGSWIDIWSSQSPLPTLQGSKALCIFPTWFFKICSLVMEPGTCPSRAVTVQHFSLLLFSSLVFGGLGISFFYLETQICYETILFQCFQHCCGFAEGWS